MKKFVSLLLAVLMVLALAACGSKQETPTQSTPQPSADQSSTGQSTSTDDPFADGPEVTLIASMTADETSIMYRATDYYGQLLSERSNGKIKLELYPSGQLGSNIEAVAAIKSGDIDIGVFPIDGTYADELAVFDLPFTYTLDEKTTDLWQEGEFRDLVDAACEKNNIKLLNIAPIEFRLSGGNAPINTMEDFKAWKIRTMENAMHMKLWQCLGATPTPLAMGETYIALSQGLVNAYENVSDAHVTTKMFEQEKYIVQTEHIMYNNAIFMSLLKFNDLPAAYQELLLSCGPEVVAFERENAGAAVDKNLKTMEDAGLTIITLSDDVKQQMFDAAQPVIKDIRAQAGDEIVDAALKGLGKM